jgi:hypothetical protein
MTRQAVGLMLVLLVALAGCGAGPTSTPGRFNSLHEAPQTSAIRQYEDLERFLRQSASAAQRAEFRADMTPDAFFKRFLRIEREVYARLSDAYTRRIYPLDPDTLSSRDRTLLSLGFVSRPERPEPAEVRQDSDRMYRALMSVSRQLQESIDLQIEELPIEPTLFLPEFVVD